MYGGLTVDLAARVKISHALTLLPKHWLTLPLPLPLPLVLVELIALFPRRTV